MGTADRPYGLRPVRHMAGGALRAEEFPFSTAIDTIGKGDCVRLSSGRIMLATAGTRTLGVWNGYRVTRSNGQQVYGQRYASGSETGGRAYIAYVYADPNILYSVQATGAVNTSDVNKNGDLAVHATADANTGQSGESIVSATAFTTGAAQLRVVGILDKEGNEAGDAFTEVLVFINEHQYRSTGIIGDGD